MFKIGTQLLISRSHGYLKDWMKSPKVRDTDISLYLYLLSYHLTLNMNFNHDMF